MVPQTVMPSEVADQPRVSEKETANTTTPPPNSVPLKQLPSEQPVNSNRSRVVSLDRGQDLLDAREAQNTLEEEDKSSSDGESSYFAKHLPSPKSGRLPFGNDTGSINSAPARTSLYGASMSRESDASLSFSDDDDDAYMTPPVPPAQLLPPSVPREDLQPHGITRMHSANSLMSSGSDERSRAREVENLYNKKGPDAATYAYYQAAYQRGVPMQMAPSQMASWIASAGPTYGAINHDNVAHSTNSNDSRGSHTTLPLVYSEDESTEGHQQRLLAMATLGGGGTGGQGAPRGGNFGGNSFTPGGGRGDLSEKEAKEAGGDTLAAANGESQSLVPAKGESNGGSSRKKGFKVYWQRWIMLLYMSLLNLLSDWTCYSVAPIAVLTTEAFGDIDPEQLVVVFLGANAVASALEPIILSRLGLRKTVVFGALLLMIGSIVKSGGLPPIIEFNLEKGEGEWRVYLGFFLVGLSQPLYQCTPALLSASWFPERERTMATGVALNANQLGIGFAFIFGTLLVSNSDDIVPYFGLLSTIATIAFIGSLLQFDDAPPTPPSDTARVIRGSLEWSLPSANSIWQSVRSFGGSNRRQDLDKSSLHTRTNGSGTTRRRGTPNSRKASAPSNASTDEPVGRGDEGMIPDLLMPSPMMPGAVAPDNAPDGADGGNDDDDDQQPNMYAPYPYPPQAYPYPFPQYPGHPGFPPGMPPMQPMPPMPPHMYGAPPPQGDEEPEQFQPPQQQPFAGQAPPPMMQYPPQMYQQPPPPYAMPYGMPYQQMPPQAYQAYQQQVQYEQQAYNQRNLDELAEPTLTITDHHLDINIRDDQIILSTKACFARPGFVHALVTFTVSGIVINTLSTFMDYLVRLNGAGREYVGIVGGSFQFVIMISSLIIGKQTDKTRAYYSVSIAMLVLGAFGLAECGVSLDANRGGDLRWSLIIVAALVGPLQPVSTELGVEVAYPLSENTVLVIQQLFSNLLSALFIPFFKALRDIGTQADVSSESSYDHPQYTFSFYLLIVLHAAVTVFFATFNGRYLRYEHELVKQEREEREEEKEQEEEYADERQPLNPVV